MSSPQLFPNTGTPQLFGNTQATPQLFGSAQSTPQLFGSQSSNNTSQLFSHTSTPQLFNANVEEVIENGDELSNDVVILMDRLISLLDEEGEEGLSMVVSGARSMYVYG